MTTIPRRKVHEVGHDERRFWLHFTDGTIVDPTRCPSNIPARSHWVRIDAAEGEPNAVCKCSDRYRSARHVGAVA